MIGCPGESKIVPERIDGFTKQMKKLGVPLVEKPADMIGKVDGMLIEALDGTVHYERAKPFLEAASPASSTSRLPAPWRTRRRSWNCRRRRSAGLLVVVAALCSRGGRVRRPTRRRERSSAARSHGPASLSPSPERNPGLYHYGIHAGGGALRAHGAGLPARHSTQRRAWTW